MYGLKEEVISKLKLIFSKYENIDKVIIYGSRAMGNYRNGSDIDLCFFGEDLSLDTLYKIEDDIEDLLLPYLFDMSIYSHLDNTGLIDHINRVGIEFYKR
jgi:predicted nucleotidyltransferase